jgi:hypothetical protein
LDVGKERIMSLGINWTQIIATVLGNAIVVPATAIFTFIVMRYFPGFWEKTEKRFIETVVKSLKSGGGNGNGKSGDDKPKT